MDSLKGTRAEMILGIAQHDAHDTGQILPLRPLRGSR